MINPLRFRRNQDFSIVSLIELKCNDSIETTKQWKIRNYSNEVRIDSSISLSQSELYIPSRVLPFGIYQFELIVTMTKYSTLQSSSFVYIEITSSGIIANLVPLGTSMITTGQKQDLRLDPGQYSVDYDANTFNRSVC